VPIYEPGLETLVQKNMEEGRLAFTTDLGPAIEQAQAIFIAVGTPPKADGSADLTFIREVATSIARHLNGYKVIVTKSTVPIGTGKMIESLIAEGSAENGHGRHTFAVVSNPEFLREGSAIDDFMHPDRVVIGSRDPKGDRAVAGRLLAARRRRRPLRHHRRRERRAHQVRLERLPGGEDRLHQRGGKSSCEALGANVEVVARGMGLDNRIGPKFLHAGPGFGGSCFPKDTRAAAQIARDCGLRFRIIEAVARRQTSAPRSGWWEDRARLSGIEGQRIGVLGLSFKPNTDDIRESPALPSCVACSTAGRRSLSSIPRPWRAASRSSPRPCSATTPTTPRPAPTRSSSALSGTSSGSSSCRASTS